MAICSSVCWEFMYRCLCISSRVACRTNGRSLSQRRAKTCPNAVIKDIINTSSRGLKTSPTQYINIENTKSVLSDGLSRIQEFLKPNDGYPPWRPSDATIANSVISVPDLATATTLTREQLIEKIRGTIYGQALGDAMGLATEFMTRPEAAKQYSAIVSKLGYIPFGQFLKDDHRTWWEEGDWTDDSDQMITILDSIIANSGNIGEIDVARRLSYWTFNGFTEIGDTSGAGLGVTVMSVVGNPNFTTSPHAVAQKVYEKSKGRAAANGGVMRTSILGIPNFHDLSKVKEQTARICKITHADPRCVSSSLLVTLCIAQMLQGQSDPAKVLQKAQAEALDYLRSATNYVDANSKEAHTKEFESYCSAPNLEELQLDQGTSIGYTFKAMGSAVVLLQSGQNFRDALTSLTMQGGDADSNGAVAGAVLGCHLGYAALPQDLLRELPHKEWLDTKVDYLLQLMRLK